MLDRTCRLLLAKILLAMTPLLPLRNRDNPDGRNHLCAPPPSASFVDTVYCFALGGAK